MINSLSPKKRFLKTDDAKKLADITSSDWFLNAATIALAEMQVRQPSTTATPAQSWDCHCKMIGAREFLSILLNLSEYEPTTSKPTDKTLKYD